MFIAAAAIAVSASAQPRTTVTANKVDDNIYVGINAGAITGFRNYYRTQDGAKQRNNAFTAYTTEVGARVGKNFTTVFGLALEGKADYVNDKIFAGLVDGRISKQVKEICLLDQVYVKAEDGKQAVGKYLETVSKDLKIVRMVRFEVGEGMEKKNEDFAAEVAAQLG